MFKSMLFLFFFSCCVAQPVEKILDQDENNIPRAGEDLMDLSSPSSEDGNKVKEILNQLSAVLTNNLHQMRDMAEAEDMKKKEMAEKKNKIKQVSKNMMRRSKQMLNRMSKENLKGKKHGLWH